MLGEASLRKLSVEGAPSVVEFMTSVLTTHGKFSLMVNNVFSEHEDFRNALNRVSGRG